MAMEWQAINSAPKGRKILGGYFNELGKWRVVLCRYYAKHTLELEDGESSEPEDVVDDVPYAPEGWYECIDNEGPVGSVSPTYWWPLPAPPGREFPN
jgi:hypothetical protein